MKFESISKFVFAQLLTTSDRIDFQIQARFQIENQIHFLNLNYPFLMCKHINFQIRTEINVQFSNPKSN